MDMEVNESVRLPSGLQTRNALLSDRFPTELGDSIGSSEWEAKAESLFCDQFAIPKNTPITADTVWTYLVQKSDQLRRFYPVVQKLLNSTYPVPSAYYMAFRWMHRSHTNGAKISYVVSTNYDEHLDSALRETSRLQHPDGHVDRVLAVEQDFTYYGETPHDSYCQILKIHGTLSHPWSIIAGDKNSATGTKPSNNIRYQALKHALRNTDIWIFIGYSFGETIVPQIIRNEIKEHSPLAVIVVDVDGSNLLAKRTFKKLPKSKLLTVASTAAEFLRKLLHEHEKVHGYSPAILSIDERRVLNEGSAHLPHREPLRVVGNLQFSDGARFHDIVHRDLHFSPLIATKLIKIVDSGEIQRLRQVRQLSFVNLKFPSATHDRFSHVVGVCYLADKLFGMLRMQKTTEAREFWEMLNIRTENDEAEARLDFAAAALLHDIGHGPYGHAMDLVRPHIAGAQPHEEDSLRMLKLAGEGKSFGDLGRILRVQKTLPDDIINLLKPDSNNPLATAIAAKHSFDLDRLDFIIRDALMAHPDGEFEICPAGSPPYKLPIQKAAEELRQSIPEILRSIVIARDNDNNLCLAYDIQNPQVERLLQIAANLYSYLYEHVYFCWQNISAQHMLTAAVRGILDSGKIRFFELLPLVDGELMKILEDSDRRTVHDLTYSIKNRRLYPLVFRARFKTASKIFAKKLKEELPLKIGALPMEIFIDVRQPRSFEITVRRVIGGKSTPVKFATMPGLIQIFAWPTCGFEKEDMEGFTVELARVEGVDITIEKLEITSSVEQLTFSEIL